MNDGMKVLLGAVIGVLIGAGLMVAYYSSGGTLLLPTRQQVAQTSENVADKAEDVVEKAADVVTAEWKIPIAQQNNSGMAGFATLNEKDGKVQVVLALATTPTASAAAVPHPAHIHLGACPTPGAIKYPLTDVVDGTSETFIPTTIAELKASLPLAINVHQSAAQLSRYIACGDLK